MKQNEQFPPWFSFSLLTLFCFLIMAEPLFKDIEEEETTTHSFSLAFHEDDDEAASTGSDDKMKISHDNIIIDDASPSLHHGIIAASHQHGEATVNNGADTKERNLALAKIEHTKERNCSSSCSCWTGSPQTQPVRRFLVSPPTTARKPKVVPMCKPPPPSSSSSSLLLHHGQSSPSCQKLDSF